MTVDRLRLPDADAVAHAHELYMQASERMRSRDNAVYDIAGVFGCQHDVADMLYTKFVDQQHVMHPDVLEGFDVFVYWVIPPTNTGMKGLAALGVPNDNGAVTCIGTIGASACA